LLNLLEERNLVKCINDMIFKIEPSELIKEAYDLIDKIKKDKLLWLFLSPEDQLLVDKYEKDLRFIQEKEKLKEVSDLSVKSVYNTHLFDIIDKLKQILEIDPELVHNIYNTVEKINKMFEDAQKIGFDLNKILFKQLHKVKLEEKERKIVYVQLSSDWKEKLKNKDSFWEKWSLETALFLTHGLPAFEAEDIEDLSVRIYKIILSNDLKLDNIELTKPILEKLYNRLKVYEKIVEYFHNILMEVSNDLERVLEIHNKWAEYETVIKEKIKLKRYDYLLKDIEKIFPGKISHEKERKRVIKMAELDVNIAKNYVSFLNEHSNGNRLERLNQIENKIAHLINLITSTIPKERGAQLLRKYINVIRKLPEEQYILLELYLLNDMKLDLDKNKLIELVTNLNYDPQNKIHELFKNGLIARLIKTYEYFIQGKYYKSIEEQYYLLVKENLKRWFVDENFDT